MDRPEILVVDDRPENLRLFETIFRAHMPECAIHTAGSGREALAFAESRNPDCALVDVQMPEMNGFELCRAFRERDEASRFPVIMITGEGSTTEFRAQCLDAGADDFISRPIENMELIARIRVMLRIREAEDRLRAANRKLEARVEERTRELEESRNDLQRVIDAIPEVLIVIEPDYRVSLANRAARKLNDGRLPESGICCHELLWRRQENCSELDLTCPLNQVLRTSVPVTWIHEYIGEDRRQRYYEISAAPVFDSRQRISRIIETCRDITHKYQTEAALRDSEELYRVTLSNITDAVFLTDDEGAFRFICPNVGVIFGWSYEEVYQMGNIEKLLGGRIYETTALDRKGELQNIECVIRNKDGDERGLLINVRRVDIRGATVLFVCRDITERRLAEKALHESEERLDMAMTGARMGMWDWDVPSGNVLYDWRWIAMLGYEQNEVDPHVDFFIAHLHPDDRDGVMKALEAHMKGNRTYYQSEHRLRKKSGEYIYVHDHGRVMERSADGRVTRVCGAVLDINERKRREEEARIRDQQLVQADKMISLGILVSGVAHEINNPNHFILSNIAPLEDLYNGMLPVVDRYVAENGDFSIDGVEFSLLRERIPDMFRNIREGSKRIRLIVDELRQFAKESPKDTVEEVQINEVVASALMLLSNMLKKCTENFSVEYGADLPVINGNYHRLEQVIINLVQNACQALSGPDQVLRVRTESDPDKGEIRVVVEDEGSGITDLDIRHITDPFYTTRRDAGGTGLGLSIAASIAGEHGGRLEFDTTPGQGTTAVITLPVTRGLS